MSGTVKFNLLSVEGLVVGKTVRVDEAFASRHGLAVPAPFSFLVPTEDDVVVLMDQAPGRGSAFVKLNFITKDRKLIENIQFVPMTLKLATTQERLNAVGRLLAGTAFQRAVANHAKPTRDLVRAVRIGDYNGVEVIGSYEDAVEGKMYLRIVGILNPNSRDGIVAIANVVASRLDLPAPNDFPRTRGGVLLKNFRFLDE
ncbi:hypothetical protein [Roseibium aggregatum]|uniref:Uncharacterized protein n=1 Tax=Roseibium aggregatum TaxID=187304 RepID=A0A939EDS6_9HYPH|nr:hypothetical protein [Roseibium aggregatum]MBN9671300.1 hypothetical protein [Roseibium aggregatum]